MVTLTLLEAHNVFGSGGVVIDERVLKRTLMSVEAGYINDNPYHNHIHAADVVQTTGYLLAQVRFRLLPPLSAPPYPLLAASPPLLPLSSLSLLLFPFLSSFLPSPVSIPIHFCVVIIPRRHFHWFPYHTADLAVSNFQARHTGCSARRRNSRLPAPRQAPPSLGLGHACVLTSLIPVVLSFSFPRLLLSGVNNAFLSIIGDELAVTYNDSAILENMHVAEFFRLVKQDG